MLTEVLRNMGPKSLLLNILWIKFFTATILWRILVKARKLYQVNIIKSNGYPAEEHETVTDDGYILKIHRMPKVTSKSKNNAPVLLMHGIVSSSADYINLYPNISLGYILWDAGYDVWLGNARGNSYCKKHLKLDESKNPSEFYNFSWHEIGVYDIPSIIDYIINTTNHKKIYYVGHSQGGTAFYVAMSLRPDYNNKIRLASLMAPGGLMSGISSKLARSLERNMEFFQNVLTTIKVYNIPYLDTLRGFVRNFCKHPAHLSECGGWFTAVVGSEDEDQAVPGLLQIILRTSPSDISWKQVIHFLQIVRSGKFCQYNYGSMKNKEIYGKAEPPEYNVSKITVPIAAYYAENDGLVNATDVRNFMKRLPNVVLEYLVPHKYFNHADFLWAKDVNRLVYAVMLKVMKKY